MRRTRLGCRSSPSLRRSCQTRPSYRRLSGPGLDWIRNKGVRKLSRLLVCVAHFGLLRNEVMPGGDVMLADTYLYPRRSYRTRLCLTRST